MTHEQMKIYNFFINNRHPNFCNIYKINEIDMFIIVDMEYISGKTMLHYFEEKRTRLSYYKILFDLIFSLQHLQQNNIVHGDIKPDNIIIKENGTPIIIDYDLGKYINEIRIVKKSIGTKVNC